MKLTHSQTFATDAGFFVGWFFKLDEGGVRLKLEDSDGTTHDAGDWPDVHAAADSVSGFAPVGGDKLFRWRGPGYQLRISNQRHALGLSKECSIIALHSKGFVDTGVRCATEAEARILIENEESA
jgi:hypothetical protein